MGHFQRQTLWYQKKSNGHKIRKKCPFIYILREIDLAAAGRNNDNFKVCRTSVYKSDQW